MNPIMDVYWLVFGGLVGRLVCRLVGWLVDLFVVWLVGLSLFLKRVGESHLLLVFICTGRSDDDWGA